MQVPLKFLHTIWECTLEWGYTAAVELVQAYIAAFHMQEERIELVAALASTQLRPYTRYQF